MSILSPTPLPGTPFFTGGGAQASSAPSEAGGVLRAPPFAVTLDGYVFAVEVAKMKIGPLDTFRDTIVANDQPTDALFNARGAWSRYRYNWDHGAGQRMGDLDELADPFRFETSIGVDWASASHQLTLSPATSQAKSMAGSTILLQQVGSKLYAGEGANLWVTSDLATWTACTAPGGTILSMCTDGVDLYVTTSTLTTRYLAGATTATAFSSPPGAGTLIAFVANRLLLAQDNVLSEVAANGTLTDIKTHFQASFNWTTVFAVGSRIYMGGFAGTRSELYSVTTDSSGNLVQSQEAAPLPMGELLNCGMGHAGIAMIGTSKGLRAADVSGDGTLTYGPLIDDFGDVRCLTADGGNAYAGWNDITSGGSGIGLLRLAVETSPLAPAFGADVYQTAVDANVTAVARFGGVTVFAVSGDGVYISSTTNYVGSGHVESGRLSFGTVEPKALIGLTVTFAPLQTGQSIEAYIYDDDGVLIGSGTANTLQATELEVDVAGEVVSFCKVKVLLNGPGTSTPILWRWRLRGYPIPPHVMQYMLPLIIAENVTINAGTGQAVSYKLGDVLAWISALQGARTYTILRIGSSEYRVRVDAYEYSGERWGDAGDYPAGTLLVQLIEA